MNQADLAKLAYKYKNIRMKIHNLSCNIAFNKKCLKNHLVPKYINVKITCKSKAAIKAKHAAEQVWIKTEINEQYAKKLILNKTLYELHLQLSQLLNPQQILQLFENIETLLKKKKNEKINKIYKKLNYLQSVQKQSIPQTSLPKNITFHPRVINLSHTKFCSNELELLNKGLKFNLEYSNEKEYMHDLILKSEVSIGSLPIEEQESTRIILNQTFENIERKNNELLPKRNSTIKNWKTLKTIKEKISNENLIISKVDKGNTIAIMNKDDYINKVQSFILSNNITKLPSDPTNKYQNKVKHQINKAKFIIPVNKKQNLKIIKPSAPKFRGLPKVHKENCPIRPLVNFQNAPTYKLSKFLETIIKNEYMFKTNVNLKNSLDLIEKVKDMNIPDNTKLVSFDIKNLYTNIPIKETLEILRRNLTTQNKLKPEEIEEIINLTTLVTEQNYFNFENDFYIQNDGLPMGSPISGLLANIFLDYIEDTNILNNSNKYSQQIIYYYRYVDDILCLFKGNTRQINMFKNFLNKIHPKLEFTSEIESNESINYLDLTITKNNHKHNFKIFRKPTYTDSVIHASSNHPHNQKMAAFNSMINRLYKIPMEKEDFNTELQTIKYIAESNGYKNHVIPRLIKTFTKKQNYIKEKPKTIYIPSEYIGKHNYKINKIFKKQGYQIGYRTNNKLGYHLNNKQHTADTSKFNNSGIYKLKCNDCQNHYIGQTGRSFNIRFQEHIKALKHQSISNYADHLNNTNHSYTNINDNLEILHICNKGPLMSTLEHLEIYKSVKEDRSQILNDRDTQELNPLFDKILKYKAEMKPRLNYN